MISKSKKQFSTACLKYRLICAKLYMQYKPKVDILNFIHSLKMSQAVIIQFY